MRVLLAEHHSKVLRALRALINEKTEHVIVGEAMDWNGLLELVNNTVPELVLLDWELPGRSTNDLLAGLQNPGYHPRLIVLSTQVEAKEKALAAGADTFISKSDAPEKLLKALK
jgi:DNA-binding NarL/FixJ family response regulator